MSQNFQHGVGTCSTLSVVFGILALGGCSFTETTTSVRLQAAPPLERIRLERPDAAVIAATWHQDGSSIVGALAVTNACRAETVKVVQRTRVTDTHGNPRYSTGAYIAGALLSVVGVGLIVNAQDKNKTVSCGSSEPVEGDTCSSEAGAWTSLGVTALGSGLATLVSGLLVQRLTPEIANHALPSEEHVTTAPAPSACGTVASLSGASISAVLSTGGKWDGKVDELGAVRIDLNGASWPRGARATLTLDSLPDSAPKVLRPAMMLGELELVAPRSGVRASAKPTASPLLASTVSARAKTPSH